MHGLKLVSRSGLWGGVGRWGGVFQLLHALRHPTSLTITRTPMSPSSLPKSGDLRPVSNPLSRTHLDRLYLLVFIFAILTAYYSWRVFRWMTEVGGWWNTASARRPSSLVAKRAATPTSDAGQGVRNDRKWKPDPESVEDKVNALAEALGVPKKELTLAIAGVVRSHIPPTGLSSDAPLMPLVASVESLSGSLGGEHQPHQRGREVFLGRDEPPDLTQQ
jgi:hypothetical protein